MSCLLIPHDLHSLAILPLHLKDQTPLSVFTGCFWYVKTCLVVSQTDGITFLAAVEWAWSQVRYLLLGLQWGLQLVVLVLGVRWMWFLSDLWVDGTASSTLVCGAQEGLNVYFRICRWRACYQVCMWVWLPLCPWEGSWDDTGWSPR